MGDGEWGIWSVCNTLPLPLLPPHALPLLQHRVLPTGFSSSGINCSSMGSPHRLHALSEACSGVSFSPGATVSFKAHPPALAWGPPWAAGGWPILPWSSPWVAGKALFWHLEHLLPSLFTDLGFCRAVSLTFSHSCPSQLLRSIFNPFLNTLS